LPPKASPPSAGRHAVETVLWPALLRLNARHPDIKVSQTQKCGRSAEKSALLSTTDIMDQACQVRFVPRADGSGLARTFFTLSIGVQI
jgi:hypothetical protein